MIKIDKNNYEAFVLDYLEGVISDRDMERLFLFLDQHPELKADLEVDVTLSLQNGVEKASFDIKSQLLRHPSEEYEISTKDFLLIKHHEEGLSQEEKAELLLVEPDKYKRQLELNTYAKTLLKANQSIEYPHKNKLQRFVLFPHFKRVLLSRSIAVVTVFVLLLSAWLLKNYSTDKPTVVTVQQVDQTADNKILADMKIVEKSLTNETNPPKDSLLKLSKDPMELKAGYQKGKEVKRTETETAQCLISIGNIEPLQIKPINAYEHGLNVMIPQYMSNNLLRKELAAIYRRIEDEQDMPPLSLALVERGVKVMNFISKESVKIEKYYNSDGKVVGYQLKGENMEVKRRVK